MPRDPIELEVFKNLFHSIAEEMGAALRRTAFSPNIKERRDYSCAVFDSAGEVIAMGDHMPVHLGSMPMSVRAAIDAHAMLPGDVVMLNDPFRGGTHLPDITLVAPVYVNGRVARARPRRQAASFRLDAGGGARATFPISTLPPAPITPTSAALTPAPWDCAARFTRKAYASLR
jgi:N-methylhydantoinase B